MKYQTVTIGTLVRNRAWVLLDFLEYIINIDYPKNKINVIFVVNDSTDESFTMLQRFKSEHSDKYNKITIDVCNYNMVEDKRESGTRFKFIFNHLANLRNYLATQCKTDKLLSIDSDILVPSNIINNLIKHDLPVISGLIYNGYSLYGNDKAWEKPNIMNVNHVEYISKDKYLTSYSHIKNNHIKNSDKLQDDKLIECDLTGAMTMIDKSVYKKVKYGYHSCGEDAYFCEEVKKLGHKIYCNLYVFGHHMMEEKQLIEYKNNK